MNLLNISFFRKIAKSKWFPLVPQIILLCVFFLLIAGAFGIGLDRDELTIKENMSYMKQLRNTNIANLLVWSYWWPLVIISAILFGRIWCSICPMELVSSVVSKFGLKKKVPKFLKSGWGITLFYTFVLVLAIHTFSIHRVPHRMAIYLITLLGLPLLLGYIFEKRAFCNYLCPVGHLLGLYSRLSIFEWRAASTAVCESCSTKECISKEKHYNIIGRSCTSNLYPMKIETNQDCLVCTQCYKVCPHDNLRFSIRKVFSDFFKNFKLQTSQLAFIVLVSGFVIYELLSEWKVSKGIVKFIPDHVIDFLNVKGTLWAPFAEAIVLFIIVPSLFFAIITLAAKIKSKISISKIAVTFALLLLPIMAAAHLTKGTYKMTSRIPYWELTIHDVKGVDTAARIQNKSIKLDKSIPGKLKPVTTTISLIAFLTALAGSLLILFKSPALKEYELSTKIFLMIGVLTYWGIFAVQLWAWRISG